MYNAHKPSSEELPSARQLLRSTVIALAAAIAILVTIVLPAEYGVDPTRIGRVLGLTEMGEIKAQLAREAEQDRQLERQLEESGDDGSSLFDRFRGLLFGTAHAQGADGTWTDEVTFTLVPGEGIEWKLVMREGAVAEYRWSAENGRVNFDLHGDGSGRSISYEKGRGSAGAEGELKAAFTGNHGWFWRNRDRRDVTVTLQLRGDYDELKRTD